MSISTQLEDLMEKTIDEHIKEILQYHSHKHPTTTIVKVIVERWYEIPVNYSRTEELLKEWFQDFSPSSSHAFRDDSLLIQKFGEVKILSKSEIFQEGEVK